MTGTTSLTSSQELVWGSWPRKARIPQMASWPPKHGKSWQIIMRPRRRTTKCPSEPVSFWIALSFSIFVIRYFSIASQWLISFNLYIYIYCIYSKTEDQTLAGKRNSYHFRMKLLFYCIWAVAPRFLKALTMCLLYLPKSKAYFPAEVLPTCTLPCHIPVEEIRWAASYIAVNEKKKISP